MTEDSFKNRESSNFSIPKPLEKYIVDQDYSKYSFEDQSVWRYIMRQLKSFLSEKAHPVYLDGLEKTGITIDKIPRISDMNEKLKKLGWMAVPVSGFIPPAAFMEFQVRHILPIATAIRTEDHISYTPAPDIVHEAAGHAPFLAHPVFNSFLKEYGKVVRKAITNRQDFEQYSAIRQLSDVKEDSHSSLEDIKIAEDKLEAINQNLQSPSEASLLSRFIWWTSEYGLIGDLKNQKIYGAGLLSSIGEAKSCFKKEVKKIPLDSSCIEYSYDITDYQPQLFVTPDFETLHEVLGELKKKCAFYRGGEYGLKLAQKAETVCTLELDTGMQISGVMENYIFETEKLLFIKMKGPCQLAFLNQELPGQGVKYHLQGYSSPLGVLKSCGVSPDKMSLSDLRSRFIKKDGFMELEFEGGFFLRGILLKEVFHQGQLLLLQFKNCEVRRGDKVYYEPSWGTFDLALGSEACSVFGGPADRLKYGDLETFSAKKLPWHAPTSEQKKKYDFYRKIRQAREAEDKSSVLLDSLIKEYRSKFAHCWLAGVELLELAYLFKQGQEKSFLEKDLLLSRDKANSKRPFIDNAIELIKKSH